MVGNQGRDRNDFGPDEQEPFGSGEETAGKDSARQVNPRREDYDDPDDEVDDDEEEEDYRPAPKPKKKTVAVPPSPKSSKSGGGRKSAKSSSTKLASSKNLELVPEGRTVFFDLPYNGAAALCYLPLVPGLAAVLWIMTENKSNTYLRFHCIQSLAITVLLVGVSVLIGTAGAILEIIPVIGGPLSFILLLVRALIAFIFMGLCFSIMVSVYKGKEGRVPGVAEISDRFMNW